MDRVMDVLRWFGVPDRVGIFGGVRKRIAEMLVEAAISMGEREFRNSVSILVEAVLDAASRRQSERPDR